MPEEKLHYEPVKQVRMGDLRDLFSSKKMAHKSLLSWYLWYVLIDLENVVIFAVDGETFINFFYPQFLVQIYQRLMTQFKKLDVAKLPFPMAHLPVLNVCLSSTNQE